MKKLITVLLLFTAVSYCQTTIDLSGITENDTLGSNCSNSQTVNSYETTGDLNLNGHTLNLRNVSLKVNGNINGDGSIIKCGQSTLCKTGILQNNPIIENGLLTDSCTTLNLQDFEEIPRNLNYKIYDMLGRLIQEGKTNSIFFPKNRILILEIEGYKPKKIIVN